MITIFNRKKVFATSSMKKQSEIRELLEMNGIDNKVGLFSSLSEIPGDVGGCGNLEYRIFVRNKDYENAQHCIRTGSCNS